MIGEPPPRFALHCHPDLAAYAAWMRDQRISNYPARVGEGKMTQEDADRGILIMSEIARLWRHAADCTLPDQPIAVDDVDMHGALAAAYAGAHALAAKSPLNPMLADRRDCLFAMMWWLRRHPRGPLTMVELTHKMRGTPRRQEAA
ncbi:hypothetical protein [Sphingomonas sp. SRS2]|uniref:hypothetical protein n=1 Tax=Sphingomonas sp. SRS2 TaxID=133190 RepID=UPI00069781F5|nr:hypothetical protein [Sphingomonas sp. SRS2]